MKEMSKQIIFTVDIEKDSLRYLKNSYRGIEEALPILLELFKEFNIVCDFFVSGDVVEKHHRIIKKLIHEEHNLGCHGYSHKLLCRRDLNYQLSDISKATKTIEKVTGFRPKMFRAPMFGANGDTIQVLENLDYVIDSSVLPGRILKKWKLFTIYDFRNVPREPYNPSNKDVTIKGNSPITEIPITENPINRGAPIGMGFLNYAGLEDTIKAINNVREDYITFLIHPWELVDLSKYYPNLPQGIYKICSSNRELFCDFISYIIEHYHVSNLEDLHEK